MRIDGAELTLVFGLGEIGAPALLYMGPDLPVGLDLAGLAALQEPGPRPSSPDDPVPASLLPEGHFGFSGEAGIAVVREGVALPTRLRIGDVAADPSAVRFTLQDDRLQLTVELGWSIDPAGMIVTRSSVTNGGTEPVAVGWLAALAMPLPTWAAEAMRFPGRWSSEWGEERSAIPAGRHELRSYGGRPGFDNPGWMVVGEAGQSEGQGRALGLHLAWSGNARSFIERRGAGLGQVQLGVPLEAGEVVLGSAERHETPAALCAFSDSGLAGVSAVFHGYVRSAIPAWPVRKVHFNSWEAAYFDYDEASLTHMAEAAAVLGAERFVLDDGWFEGRRDPARALGDWRVDEGRFPGGLGSLIARVRCLGMDFGLWVEPEMVSPDSDLYRAHPDWCLALPGRARPTQRAQLVLDLTRADVADHLFEALDRVVSDHDIAYLKWDHNRDLFPAWSSSGPVSTQQTQALYRLLDRVRSAHPGLEVEACASGGARTDLALLGRTGRVWVSDNTDAVERLRIQRTAGLFLPPETLGSHVGASPNPITGRRLDMAFRARVAMFGHMGLELDPRSLDAVDRETLAHHIGLYKRFRALLSGGRAFRIDGPAAGQIVVAGDGSEALGLVACAAGLAAADTAAIRLPGLDPQRLYRVRLIEPWPSPAAGLLANPDAWRAGMTVAGAQLGATGVRLPLVHPETAWLVHLEALA